MLSVTLVDIISIIRHVFLEVAVSYYSYLGLSHAVGDSCYAVGCRQKTEAIILGTWNIIYNHYKSVTVTNRTAKT